VAVVRRGGMQRCRAAASRVTLCVQPEPVAAVQDADVPGEMMGAARASKEHQVVYIVGGLC